MGLPSVIWHTVAFFSRESTVAGINHAGRSKSWLRAIYWISIFAVGTYFTIGQVITVIADYQTYPYVTSTDLTHETKVEFPAISFCNLNSLENGNLTPDTAQQLAKELGTLGKIAEMTGCMGQLCTMIDFYIDNERDASEPDYADDLVFLSEDTCWGLALRLQLKERYNKLCYYCYLMQADTDSSEVKAIRSGMYFEQFNCSMDDVCEHIREEIERPGTPHDLLKGKYSYCEEQFSPKKKNKKDEGEGESSSSNGTSARRKRQAGFSEEDIKDMDPMMGQGVSSDFDNDVKFLQEYLKLPVETRELIGHRFESSQAQIGEIRGFISNCIYRGTSCLNKEYWLPFQSSGFGNCYTFNSAYNEKDSNTRTSSLTGLNNGLTVELFLDQDNYMVNKLSKKAGARLVVHSAKSSPLPDEFGIDLMPNTASSIAIQTNKIHRLTAPYEANCSNSWADTGYNIETDVEYSFGACQRYCLEEEILSNCSCFHPNLVPLRIPLSMEADPCLITPNNSNDDYLCFKKILDEFDSGDRTCNCHVPCHEIEYNSDVTISTWPSNQYWKDLAVGLGYMEPGDDLQWSPPELDAVSQKIQQNFVQANIYYQTLNVRKIEQTPKYSFDSFLSSFGGALSLFMGIAIVMAFELMELALDLVLNIWAYYNPKKEIKI